MVHDRWSDVLFLHWKVPSDLESCLTENIPPSLILDRYDEYISSDSDDKKNSQQSSSNNNNDDSSCLWIGLVLLTEVRVGPSVGRTNWTCVTHHGVNVRTYIKGCKQQQHQQQRQQQHQQQQTNQRPYSLSPSLVRSPPGIYFFSLECNDEFTAFGANYFGMPYRVAEIMRHQQEKPQKQFFISSKRIDRNDGRPSIIRTASRTIRNIFARTIQRIYNKIQDLIVQVPLLRQPSSSSSSSNDDKTSEPRSSTSPETRTISPTHQSSSSFKVECQWTVVDDEEQKFTKESNPNSCFMKKDDPKLAEWLMERYHVYTNKYGVDWIGTISHEPWPTTMSPTSMAVPTNPKRRQQMDVRLDRLEISNVETYQPQNIRPLLKYMSFNRPDSVLFSPGVGPIEFQMLQPVKFLKK